MRIPVIFTDQSRGFARQEELEELIQSKGITAFYRSTEYVKIDLDPIRGNGGRRYVGPERRGNLQNY
jgi:hypothetical protein